MTVTTPIDLLRAATWPPAGERPEMDPLTEADALVEAQLVEVLIISTVLRCGLLFDLRQALQLRRGNTALLLFDGLREFDWVADRWETARTAWNVVSSTPESDDRGMALLLDFFPDARAHVVAGRAAFYVGNVPHLLDRPPDFGDDSDATIAEQMATMQSVFEIASAAVTQG